MAKGVDVPEECLQVFTALSTGPSETAPKYIIFRMTDDFLASAVDHVASPGATYEDMTLQLPPQHCRWIVYSLDSSDSPSLLEKNVPRTLCFMAWFPEKAPIKQKMLYSASKGFFRRAFPGGADMFLIQATSLDEIAQPVVVERVLEKNSFL
ncbi:hypothetical protein EDD21DRAFT_303078 [Dissophora ornata]|nr:hypothetical protein EDD21DRAFT_303078 [Dissophora ornata]